MITFVKQMQITLNFCDGDRIHQRESDLTPREKQKAITGEVSLIMYLSYMFNLQSSVIGPSFEYPDWEQFINLKGHHAQMRPFSNWFVAIKRFLTGIGIMVVGLVLSGYFDLWHVLTPEFASFMYPYQVFFAVMVTI